LAAMILDKDNIDEALARVRTEAFYRPSHQRIFTAIKELSERHEPVDLLTLADRLQATGDLDKVGGKAYLAQLADNAFATYNWMRHAEIINRHALMRELVAAADHITALGFSQSDDLDAVIEDSEKTLFEVTNKKVDESFRSLEDLLQDADEMMTEMAQSSNHILGVPTGFSDLDRLLSGLRGGDLIVLAARPGIGKSALALNMAVNAAKEGVQVAFFSLEMPAIQLTQRLISSEAGIDSSRIRNGNLQMSDWTEIGNAYNRLNVLRFDIDDSPGLSLIELRAKARRQLRNISKVSAVPGERLANDRKINGPSLGKGLVIVDYLQLMESRGMVRDRHLEVGEFSRGLKILAKELDVPVLALSQLSRVVETRKDKRPQLSDLRESGSIEQDADVVLFIDRSISQKESAAQDRPDDGQAVLIIGKNRNGPTKDINLIYDYKFTRFKDGFTNDGQGVAGAGGYAGGGYGGGGYGSGGYAGGGGGGYSTGSYGSGGDYPLE